MLFIHKVLLAGVISEFTIISRCRGASPPKWRDFHHAIFTIWITLINGGWLSYFSYFLFHFCVFFVSNGVSVCEYSRSTFLSLGNYSLGKEYNLMIFSLFSIFGMLLQKNYNLMLFSCDSYPLFNIFAPFSSPKIPCLYMKTLFHPFLSVSAN